MTVQLGVLGRRRLLTAATFLRPEVGGACQHRTANHAGAISLHTFAGFLSPGVEISGCLQPSAALTDDALTLTITITGSGDIKRVQAPRPFQVPASFERTTRKWRRNRL